MTAYVGGLTIRDDDSGDSLVVERYDDGHISVWIEDCNDVASRPVVLSDEDRRSVAAYLIEGLK